METDFDVYLRQRDQVQAEDDDARFGSVPALVPGHTLVVACEKHKHDGQLKHIGQAYWMEDHRVAANVAQGIVKTATLEPFDYWLAPGRVLGAEDVYDAAPYATAPTPGALRILAGCNFDPGCAAFRLHSAINEHTKHASAFVRWGDENPHCSLRQLDGRDDLGKARDAFLQADVLHNHVAYMVVNNIGIRPRPDQLLVRHYHGSKPNGTWIDKNLDYFRGAKLFGARLSLVEEAKSLGLEMEWSPIPVPMARYRALSADLRRRYKWHPIDGTATAFRPLVVAHSPTEAKIKGTADLVAVVTKLQQMGVPVRLAMIQNMSLLESLRVKAMSDVCFDSFWLGIQGSGLEAGAMGLPVIAGDADVRTLYEREFGAAPYTFAGDRVALYDVLERMAMDHLYRAQEAERVVRYVRQVHDYPMVARRYEASLAKWLGRTDVFTHQA